MKTNVDLTENRDFREKQQLGLRKKRILMISIGKKYPWGFKINNDNNDGIFLTGNKEDRKCKKDTSNYMGGISCECCGADLTKKPWITNNYGLCQKCIGPFLKKVNHTHVIPW